MAKLKLITTTVQCRGCQHPCTLEFQEPSLFGTALVPFKCKKCGSKCVTAVKKHLLNKKIEIKTSMVQHTKTLMSMLKRRQLNA